MTPAARRLAADPHRRRRQVQPLMGEDGAGAAKAVRKRHEGATDHVRRAGQLCPDCEVRRRDLERPLNVCAVQRRRCPVGASPTRQPLQPEAIEAVMEVTKWQKPSASWVTDW